MMLIYLMIVLGLDVLVNGYPVIDGKLCQDSCLDTLHK